MTKFKAVATEWAKSYMLFTRKDDTKFFAIKYNDAPLWLNDAEVMDGICKAVDKRPFCDWVQTITHPLVWSVSRCESEKQARKEAKGWANSLIDTHASERYDWLAGSSFNADLCEEAWGDLSEDTQHNLCGMSISYRISLGQYLGIRRITEEIIKAVAREAALRGE